MSKLEYGFTDITGTEWPDHVIDDINRDIDKGNFDIARSKIRGQMELSGCFVRV